jgi:hypothetical protein
MAPARVAAVSQAARLAFLLTAGSLRNEPSKLTLQPPPPELAGREMKLEFVSMLAQMQRAAGLTAIERTAGFIGSLAGVQPGALDKLDADQAIDEYADIMGAPASMIRPDEAVAGLREASARAQAAERLAAAAGPVLQGAQAARILSQTEVGGGESALERMLGER